MLFGARAIRRLVLVVGTAWLALALSGPAKANDWWNSFMKSFGWGASAPADGAIDYDARPALVVPPKMDLPPPQPTAARPADWPKDPDAAARYRAEADSRRPAPPAPPPDQDVTSADDSDQPAKTPPSAKFKRVTAPNWIGSQSAGLSGAGTSVFSGGSSMFDLRGFDITNVSTWNPFKSVDDSQATRTLKVGVEPPREYLTQPPSGYRAPVAVDPNDLNQATQAAQAAQTAAAKKNAPQADPALSPDKRVSLGN